MHDDFVVPKWRLDDVILIGLGDKVFSIEKEGPHFVCYLCVAMGGMTEELILW